MMKVLVLSKTHMGGLACVGGIVLESLKPVRLHCSPKGYQPGDTKFEVGQVWDISFVPSPDLPPHIEDVIVTKKELFSEKFDINELVSNHCAIWKGSPDELFDSTIQWEVGGSGYVNSDNVPHNSVGFWISDRDLHLNGEHYFYSPQMRLKYIGYNQPLKVIPAGTIIRVSLPKWWIKPGVDEKRCYLQLSGWY